MAFCVEIVLFLKNLAMLYNKKAKLTGCFFRGCLKTIVNGSEFSECYDYGCDHEHFVGGFCRLFVVSA